MHTYAVEKDKKSTKDSRGQYHSNNDLPAVIYNSGIKVWYLHGLIHRETGPAVMFDNGIMLFYKCGVLYNVTCKKDESKYQKFTYDEMGELHSYGDFPSLVHKTGIKLWHKHGVIHRDNEMPAVIYPAGGKEYYLHGLLTKSDEYFMYRSHLLELKKQFERDKFTITKDEEGRAHSHNNDPAIVFSTGVKYWCKNGLIHREGKFPAIQKPCGTKEYWDNGQFLCYYKNN